MVALPAAAGIGGTEAPADVTEAQTALDRIEEVPTENVAAFDEAAIADVATDDEDADDESSADVRIDESLLESDEASEVIVFVEDADLPLLESQESAVVDELKAHATESQEPLVEYAERTDGVEVRNQFWLANAVLLEVDFDRADAEDLVAQEGVEAVQENFEVERPTPEPSASELETADEQPATYGLDQINAPDVWEEYDTRGEGARIAVLDTGVDPDHPAIDLDEDNWAEFSFDGSQVEDSEPYDTGFHGTHVSGTVVGGNESGTQIGVAPEAELMHGLVLGGVSATFAQIIGGMEWAVEEEADVISMSLGADGHHPEFIKPTQNAVEAGTLVISSAGNSEEGVTGTPANVYEAFSIGASDEEADIAEFSSGELIDTEDDWPVTPTEWPDEYVVPDVAAPGVDVTSALPDGVGLEDAAGNVICAEEELYCELSGTSMSAPHVAGTMALAISAAEDDLTIEQREAMLETTAWKPDDWDESEANAVIDGQDTRYGHGIIDAKAAVDRIAADGGVTGTVMASDDGEPVPNADVVLDGFPTETNEDGEYTIGAGDGEFELAVEAFGFESATETVAVEDGEFTEHDVELDRELAVSVAELQPRAVEAGDDVTAQLDVAHAGSLTVDIGGYDADVATLYVDGEEADFGETVEMDDHYVGPLEIVVETDAEVSGSLALEYEIDGFGETEHVQTGPTDVVTEPLDIGVVTAGGQEETVTGAYLEDALDFQYVVSHLSLEEAADNAGEFDAFVVQTLGDDADLVEEFLAETSTPEVGVIYLEQFDQPVDGIDHLAATTGNPSQVGVYTDVFPTGNVFYEIQNEHPIVDDVLGGYATVSNPPEVPFAGGDFHAFFEHYDGEFHSEALATTATGWSSPGFDATTGTGLVVEDNSRTVLAASLTPGGLIESDHMTDDARDILANAVDHVVEPPTAHLAEPSPDRVDPGAEATVPVAADDLERIKVDVSDGSLDEDDLSLYIDGSINAFGEYRAFAEPVDGEVEVAVSGEEVGNYELEITAESVDEFGGTETTEMTVKSTSIHPEPLEVGEDRDVETLEAALDIVADGGEIEVHDGHYVNSEELPEVRFGEAMYVVDTPGVTISAAEGAEPTFEHGSSVVTTEYQGFAVRADDVTIDGLSVNVDEDGETIEEELNAINIDGFDGLTVSNVTTAGSQGVSFSQAADIEIVDTTVSEITLDFLVAAFNTEGQVSDVRIENATVENAANSVNYGDESSNLTVVDSDLTGGVTLSNADATIVDSEIDADGGLGVEVSGEAHVERTDIENASTGIEFRFSRDEGNVSAVDNHITDSDVGIELTDSFSGAEITENVIEAETGVHFESHTGVTYYDVDGTDADVYYNDFGDTDVALSDGGTEDEAQIDGRLNYVGDGDASTANVTHAPYLTTQPHDDLPPRDEVTEIGVDLQLDAGEATAVGIPGPTTQTVTDLFDDEFEGVSYGFDAEEQAWNHLTPNDDLGALDALVVVADTDGSAHLEFTSDDAPSGPGQASLSKGWNFVAPPTYGGADDAFEHATTDVSLVMHTEDRPAGQIAPAGDLDGIYAGDGDEPRVSPFEGYFVFADDDGVVPAHLASDPTTTQLYESLGAADHLEVDGADADGSVDTVEGVLASDLEGDDLERALVTTVYAELRTAVDDDASVEDALLAVAGVNADTLESAEDEELVEDAVQTATGLFLGQAFDIDVPPQADEDDDADDSTALNRSPSVGLAASG